jgi:hypothetical protein
MAKIAISLRKNLIMPIAAARQGVFAASVHKAFFKRKQAYQPAQITFISVPFNLSGSLQKLP